MFTPQVLDHFQNPRNAGIIESPDAAATRENPVCGDTLQLTLTIAAGRITAIRFLASGCVPVIACGSALTELACGKALAQARVLAPSDLITVLGSLPPASSHAADLALETLRHALICR